MSKTVTFRLPVIESRHVSGTSLLSVATEFESIFIAKTRTALARAFERAATASLISGGEYAALLKYLVGTELEGDWLEVEVPTSKKRFDDEPHTVRFPIIIWKYEDGHVLAAIPAIGLACYVKEKEKLKESFAKIILLELKRNQRLNNNRSLIAAQWYGEPVVHYENIELEFYTPVELQNLAEGEDAKILPKACSRMNRTKREFYGIDNYLGQISRNLEGEYRQSVLIVGPSGCGKSALMHAYVEKVGKRWQKRPWHTTASQMLQALTEDGGWQYGLGQWTKELRDSGDVAFIGNLAEWFEVGQYSGNSVSIAEALREPLQRNELVLVAEATPEQLEKIELKSPGYSQLFHLIQFKERSIDLENQIAEQAVLHLAERNKVTIPKDAIKRVTFLQRRYAPYSGYPGKIIRFFEALILQQKEDSNTLSESDALHAFCEESGMPKFLIDPEARFAKNEAEAFFSGKVIGQSTAVEEVIRALVAVKTRMTRGGRPIASLLFVGPTGVGKTQMAKTLAQYMFGDSQRMIRFDMSEFSDPYSVLRMVGSGEGSLVNKVRQSPFSVILFDEIEKAAYNFFDLLLQVLGEGRLTDDKGDVANFCSTLIIMTSNMGAQEYMKPQLGFNPQGEQKQNIAKHFESVVTKYFRPEFFNRIDHLIPFIPLSGDEQLEVLKKEVGILLQAPGIVNRHLNIEIKDGTWAWLAALKIDFRYGARALQRVLTQKLIWPLSAELSKFSVDEPLQVSISAGAELANIYCESLTEERRSSGVFAEYSDRVSNLRRQVQGLTASSTWIGLLSNLDKLETKKRKKKENFWSNSGWVKEYTELSQLLERLEVVVKAVDQLESECVVQIQGDTSQIDWACYESQLDKLNQNFMALLFDIEAMVNPKYNELLLAIYGNETWCEYLVNMYKSMLQAHGLETNTFYCYLRKAGFKPGQAELDDTDVNKDLKSYYAIQHLGLEPGEFDLDEIEYPYWFARKKSENKQLQAIGSLLSIKGKCAAHYLSEEGGVYEIKINENESALVFVEIEPLKPTEYLVPEGVYRQKFYSGKKASRKYEEYEFVDKRYTSPEGAVLPVPIREHGSRLRTIAVDKIRGKLLKLSRINEPTVGPR